jgi:hypothetical protein
VSAESPSNISPNPSKKKEPMQKFDNPFWDFINGGKNKKTTTRRKE